MAKKDNKKSKKNKNIGFAWALWLLIAILILLVFLVKKDTIISNLKITGFFDRVFGSTPQFVEKHEIVEKEQKTSKKKNKDENVIVVDVITEKPTMDSLKNDNKSEALVLKDNNSVIQIAEEETVRVPEKKVEPEKEKAIPAEVRPIEKKEEPKIEAQKAVEQKKTDLSLCFLLFDSDGGVSRKIIKRSVTKSESPLTESINLLLKGPVVSNATEKSCISLIPEGTRLLSAKVQDGVAYLNFSEEFEFNSYAAEGYRHQLEQIVFTATSFSTVKSVQFLIEGVQEQYLGSEGVWIGSPLSRSSF